MSLTRQISERLNNGDSVAVIKRYLAQEKSGPVLELWSRWVEKHWVEVSLQQNKTPQFIWGYILANGADFTCKWSMARIQKMRIRMGLQPRSQPVIEQHETIIYDIDEKRGFGVEIEMICRLSKRELAVKMEAVGLKVMVGERRDTHHTKWKLTWDGSITGQGGIEAVSPILKGKAGLKEIETLCKLLKECNAKINGSCGLHVHHQVTTSGVEDIKILQNAAFIYHKFQAQINKMLPPSRRFANTCHPHSSDDIQYIMEATQEIGLDGTRYRAVNVEAYTKHGTCEFRQHSGSVEAEKICNWVVITQAIMVKAIQFARTSSDIQRHQFKRQLVEELNLRQELVEYINKRIQRLNKNAA